MREYFENLYPKKLKKLEEMDKFLDTYDLPKLNQDDINSPNRCIAHNEVEVVMKSLPTKLLIALEKFSAAFC
jgi:hypothetical protein